MIHYIQDWDAYGYDGVIADGVVMCLEVYVGEPGGPEGVKLENQIPSPTTAPKCSTPSPWHSPHTDSAKSETSA